MTTAINPITKRKLGPMDCGFPMTFDEFMKGNYQEGYQYELIDGELYVFPFPNLSENRIENWIGLKLQTYSREYPQIINYVTNKARVFVPGRAPVTVLGPDLTAYHDFPLDRPWKKIRWQDVSPILVVEVVSKDDPYKDLVRNVKLYLQVPTIQEYWLIDPRKNPERPTFRVHRRQRKGWRIIQPIFGSVYTTKLLPWFALIIDPRS
jgi:Uma2 family endonuclease